MFPNIFTLGIAGLGPMTSKGSGLILYRLSNSGKDSRGPSALNRRASFFAAQGFSVG
jgi:hypothetical protein